MSGAFHQPNPRLRRPAARRHYQCEPLERRVLLSGAPDPIQPASLLLDVNTSVADSSPAQFTDVNGIAYFFADDGQSGRELWRSDGSAGGTWRVKDIFPGVDSANTTADSTGLQATTAGPTINLNGTLLFAAARDFVGLELWRSDGTEAGTSLVKDLYFSGGSTPGGFIRLNETTALFTANSNGGFLPNEVWRTDGTTAGTTLVKRFIGGSLTGSGQLGFGVDRAAVFGGNLIFSANGDDGRGIEPWSTDGTPLGTGILADISSGFDSNPTQFTVVGDMLYFTTGFVASNPDQLWRFDLNDVVSLVKSRANGANIGPSFPEKVGGRLVYRDVRADGTGQALWAINAPGAAPVMVADITSLTLVNSITGVGNYAIFPGRDSAAGTEMWAFDGTSTYRLADITPGTGSTAISNVVAAGSRVYFSASSQLWTTDGTVAGTYRLGGDVGLVAPSSSGTPLAFGFKQIGSNVFFNGRTPGTGNEPYVTDGTPEGTHLIVDLNDGTQGSSPSTAIQLPSGKLLFRASDGTHGLEWWVSDGTTAATQLLIDLPVTMTNSSTYRRHGAELYFTAGANSDELWKTDGTAAGTVHVATFRPTSGGSSTTGIRSLTSVAGSLYFFAYDAAGVSWLYKSDGTAANTVQLKQLANSSTVSDTTMVEMNGEIYFSASTAAAGIELWKTSGTPAGTVLVSDIRPGTVSSNPSDLAVLGNYVLFTPSDDRTLWRSDGTAAGTVQVSQQFTYPGGFTTYHGEAYFTAFPIGTDRGPTLWKTDGTAEGTALVKFVPATDSSYSIARTLVVSGDRLYLPIEEDETGMELWTSDGTTQGTYRIDDFEPGPLTSNPRALTDVNGLLYFSCSTGVWRTDGTPQGTERVAAVSQASSVWITLADGGDTLYFSANDGLHGAEVWAVATKLPDWVADGSAATWNTVERKLQVSGFATIVADPLGMPVVSVNGTTAALTIDLAFGLVVHLGGLSVTGGATVTLASLGSSRSAANHRTLIIDGVDLTVDADSTLDLADNDLILDYDEASDPFDDVAALLARGHNFGDWAGAGITSSAARDDLRFSLGIIDNADITDETSLLIKFTWAGDLNLDGLIDFQDLSVFNTNYDHGAVGGRRWLDGDFNYDGVIDFQDLSLFYTNYDPNKPAV